jgi:hypothetical protein
VNLTCGGRDLDSHAVHKAKALWDLLVVQSPGNPELHVGRKFLVGQEDIFPDRVNII